MKRKFYEIYGVKVEVVAMTTATVTYKTLHNNLVHRIGKKQWNANAKRIEDQ